MLSPEEIERIRSEHGCAAYQLGLIMRRVCMTCRTSDGDHARPWPCDAARLLAHFAPGPVPHLAEVQARIAYGLFGPSTSEELAR